MRAVVAIALLAGCSAPTISVTLEAPPEPALRVETWEVDLRSTYSPAIASRLDLVVDSLLKTPDDVDAICLTGVGTAREKLLTRVAPRWPHHGFQKTTASTPPDDPRDLLGVPRTPPMTPACTTKEDIDAFNGMLDCLRDKCQRVDGTLDNSCGYPQCGSKLPRPPSGRCQGCIDTALGWLSLGEARTQCLERPRGELARDGELAALILSKRELRDVRAHVLPTTFDPRGAISATLDVGNTAVTIYCADIGIGLYDPTAQYPGVYGATFEGNDGFLAEYQLGYEQLTDAVWALGRNQPTLLLGHSFFLWQFGDTGVPETTPQLTSFSANFQPLFAPTIGMCTHCMRTNPFNKGGKSSFQAALFASSTRPVTVASEVTIHRDETVVVDGQKLAASPHYGARVTVRFP